METFNNYQNALRKKYKSDKANSILIGDLYEPTPARIRNICLSLQINDLSKNDLKVLLDFFNCPNLDNLRSEIKKIDLDRLKPICKFLKEENEYMNLTDTVELTALLLDFKPRPFRKFLNGGKEKVFTKDKPALSTLTDKISDDVESDNQTKSEISTNDKSKKHRIILIIILLIILSSYLVYKVTQLRWMKWENDKYVEVHFDLKKYEFSELEPYDEDIMLNFRKESVHCSTPFFTPKKKPKIWYGKNAKKELEYFTSLGFHPETGKLLKPITDYMINKYVCANK